MKVWVWSLIILWSASMLTMFVWGDWRRALLLALFPVAMVVVNLIAIPVVIIAGVVWGFWKATGRTFGISVEFV